MNQIKKDGFKLFRANDDKYDGKLAATDAPAGAFFNVNANKMRYWDRCGSVLPNKTPYPRGSHREKRFPRLVARISTLDLEYYTLFLVKVPTNTGTGYQQVHVALIANNNTKAIKWAERNLAQRLDTRNNEYFRKMEESWYCKMYDDNYVTNIFLVPSKKEKNLKFLLAENEHSWQTVIHM